MILASGAGLLWVFWPGLEDQERRLQRLEATRRGFQTFVIQITDSR